MPFNQQSEKNPVTGMKMSILHTAGLNNAPAHKVQDYIYEHTFKGQNALPTEIPRKKPQDLCDYSLVSTPSLPKGETSEHR